MRIKLLTMALLCVPGTIVLALSVISAAGQRTAPMPAAPPPPTAARSAVPHVIFNQDVIDGLYSQLDLNDLDAVFQTVFAALKHEVVVYPTENYYYFKLLTAGKEIWGNLRLDASDRDQGVIHLGLFEYDENGQYQDREGKLKSFSARDGVRVERVESLVYAVSHAGRTVTFRLNDIGAERPRLARLRDNEEFLGPIFDESGLKFFLLFNRQAKRFLYILNEEGQVPEHFLAVNKEVLIGRRTAFAFFKDEANNRKVLVGAHGRSVDRNNYYDGPFDQLPDNQVAQTKLGKYLEEVYPFTRGQIDAYGVYKAQQSGRVLVFPYTVYYEVDEIVKLVESARQAGGSADEFYTRITPDPFAGVTMTDPATVDAPAPAPGGALLTGKVLGAEKPKSVQPGGR